ncbi:TRAP transporter small permease [Lysinibacillus capsici]|uniref:TRAP transporter small permease n=1 Tax=Lysinibacillus capsici TaxID=2115968 RepID=UPI0032DE8AD6
MKFLDYFEEIILSVTFAAITFITFVNIVSRNLVNLSLSFTEEITVNLLVLLTFVGTALGVRRYAHLGFTLLFDKGNKLTKKAIVIISSVASGVLFAVLLYYGIDMVLFQMQINQTTPALGMPQWILSSALPLGALLCLIRTVQAMVEEYKAVSNEGNGAEGDELI